MDALLKRCMHSFGDPNKRDNPVYGHSSLAWYGNEGSWEEGITTLALDVFDVKSRQYQITYGVIVDALLGLNRIRLRYPKLEMSCMIINDMRHLSVKLGQLDSSSWVLIVPCRWIPLESRCWFSGNALMHTLVMQEKIYLNGTTASINKIILANEKKLPLQSANG